MPSQMRRIAQTYLRNPVEVTIQAKTTHRDQHPPALLVGQRHAQARRVDAHPGSRAVRGDDRVRAHQARHRRAGAEAAGAGFSAAAINGDVEQKQRERTIQR
jgi:ATP-dependent RNA helicase DeaD